MMRRMSRITLGWSFPVIFEISRDDMAGMPPLVVWMFVMLLLVENNERVYASCVRISVFGDDHAVLQITAEAFWRVASGSKN